MAIDITRLGLNTLIAQKEGLDSTGALKTGLLGTLIGGGSPAIGLLVTQQLARREVPPAETASTPAADTAEIADFRLQEGEKARKSLQRDFKVAIRYVKVPAVTAGYVVDQNPKAGRYTKGTEVTLSISTGNKETAETTPDGIQAESRQIKPSRS